MLRDITNVVRGHWNNRFRGKEIEAHIEEVTWTRGHDGTDHVKAVYDFRGTEADTLLASLVIGFRDIGAANYLELSYVDPVSVESYTVTVQRRAGKTPGEVNLILRQALEKIAKHDATMPPFAEARLSLLRCGYPDPAQPATTTPEVSHE